MSVQMPEGDRSRAAVLRMIAFEGPVARSAIAEGLQVSPATVTAITRELIAAGLVEMAGKAAAAGRGRPSELLAIVPGAVSLLGAKVMEDHVTWVLADLRGDVLQAGAVTFDPRPEDPAGRLAGVLAEVIGGVDGSLLGVGLGVPGTVATDDDGIVTSPMFGWHALPLGHRVAERLGLPVVVDNDVNTLAVAQHLYGSARDLDDFVTVTVGRGIGLGIFLDGALRRGQRGGAGELGHTLAVPDGPVCDCGRAGCLEAVAAAPAILDRARANGLLGAAEGMDVLVAAAETSGPIRAVFVEAGAHLGVAVADLVNLLAPGAVIISGEGVAAWSYLRAGFEPAFAARVLPVHTDTTIVVEPWDDQNWARGAAALVLRSAYASAADFARPELDIRNRLHGVATEATA
jgi:predicted NBD/HSP70 family sugar kinase